MHSRTRPDPASDQRRVLALLGLRGAGKTTVGRRVAELAGLAFSDLDEELARTVASVWPELAGRGAGALLDPLGRARFRALEALVLAAILEPERVSGGVCEIDLDEDLEPWRHALAATLSQVSCSVDRATVVVLATGGGVIELPANRARLFARTHRVWLRARPETLAERIGRDPTLRPALAGVTPLEEARLLAQRRGPAYAGLAEAVLDVDELDVDACARRILDACALLFGVRVGGDGARLEVPRERSTKPPAKKPRPA